jgi:flavorubredoxin
MITKELFNKGDRSWIFIGRDPDKKETLIDTNEYLIVNKGKGTLLDPGGIEIFPSVIAALSREIKMENIESIFSSHQDPDTSSSLSLWLGVCPDIDVYAPGIWSLFISHFGEARPINPIPDGGMNLPLGGSNDLELIPAHYLHSSGNFSLYDPQAKILFSGDIGGALLPKDKTALFVEDFDSHIQYMEGFLKRLMPSNTAKNKWIKRVRGLDIDMMCPQHGTIFKGGDVGRFLDWFEKLEVGIAE